MNRILIAGTGSGCGKTTITLGILKALTDRGVKVQPYKTGPDFIDPQFHTYVTGRSSRNLDSWMLTAPMLQYLVTKHGADADLSVIEGVMGFYDGRLADPLSGSTAELSSHIRTPVILTVNCRGMALSIAALINGFKGFLDDQPIAGVILNNIRPQTYKILKPQLELYTGVRVAGYLPPLPNLVLPERQLGLMSPEELPDLDEQLNQLGAQVNETIDLDHLIRVSKQAPVLSASAPEELSAALDWARSGERESVRLGIARDQAFSFYYQDNLDLLSEMNVDWVPFSPLSDRSLPDDLDGIYFGGGYPERFAASLADNQTMRLSIQAAMNKDLPTIAEGGGFLYLGETLRDETGDTYKMCGVLPVNAHMTDRLSRFGYVTLQARGDGPTLAKGGMVKAHEFHYSATDNDGDGFTIQKSTSSGWTGGHVSSVFQAAYPHVHWYANPVAAARFTQICRGKRF